MKYLFFIIALLLLCWSVSVGQERYVLPCRTDLFVEYQNVIESQMGILEATGHNDGEVTKYHKRFGVYSKNVYYCNYGLLWSWFQACQNLNYDYSEVPVPVSGLARSSFLYARKHGTKTKYHPEVGDNGVMRNVNSSWSGHVFSVDSVGRKGWIYTNEFNTSSGNIGSQSNGNGNHKRKRNYLIPTAQLKLMGFVGFVSKSK